MTVHSDAQLAAAGDVEAFEKIYHRHHQKVYSICLRMVRNASQAEDLTQDVFIQVFRKLHTFRNDSSFSTWLYLSLTKSIEFGFTKLEADRFEIRFDYFNSLNTPQFAPGTGDVTDTTFNDFRFNSGNLNIGNVNAGRIGQFQLRYVF